MDIWFWLPKSLNISKAIDKAEGVERTEVIGTRHRNVKPFNDDEGWNKNNTQGDYEYKAPATKEAEQWDGWGSALKPAHEPIVLARKPLIGTIVENVLEHGTGGLNIDGCRINTQDNLNGGAYNEAGNVYTLLGATSQKSIQMNISNQRVAGLQI